MGWFKVGVSLGLVSGLLALAGCCGGGDEDDNTGVLVVPESVLEPAQQAGQVEQATPAPVVNMHGDRPDNMPCQLVSHSNFGGGAVDNWWNLKYEDGRLVSARDEEVGYRKVFRAQLSLTEYKEHFDTKPWGIAYSYDDAGRLVKYEKTDWEGDVTTITFSYDGEGRLESLTDQYGVHSLERDAEGRVIRESFEMPVVGKVQSRFVYENTTSTWPVPLVYGRGEVYFGQTKTYMTMSGNPEDLLVEFVGGGPGGGLAGANSKHYNYEFRYDCSVEPTF